MRRTRLLFPLAILVILGAVGASYRLQILSQRHSSPAKPKSLPLNIQASSSDWVYFRGDADKPVVEIRARNMERSEGPSGKVLLEGVELRLYHKQGRQFDYVKSSRAEFDETEGYLFSDGDVEITLAVPSDAGRQGRLMQIRSSGVRFDAATGKATTEREASFHFDLGEGKAVGASYDPAARQLELAGGVDLTWRGNRSDSPPMRLEAAALTYREEESKVYLTGWARLSRAGLSMESEDAVISLSEGAIRQVEARNAHGTDHYPNRDLRFGAALLRMELNDRSEIERISGEGSARLDVAHPSGATAVRTDNIQLSFEVANRRSLLREAIANGATVLESHPRNLPGRPAQAARILKSEVVVVRMKPGGEELDQVETQSPGKLEFVPAAPGQPRRELSSERMWIHYGERNQIAGYRAVDVRTRTTRPAARPGQPPAVAETSSRDFEAFFDPETGELRRIVQWNQFRYKEAERQAAAARAVMDQATNVITLSDGARMWDASGSVSAVRIELDQNADRFLAEGDVQSTRRPEARDASGGLLNGAEPIQARAARMVSSRGNRHILYEGKAVLWQGASRLHAERIEIERDKRRLRALGEVFTQLLDQPAEPGRTALFTVVRAAALDYDESTRLAHYQGGVRLQRLNLELRSRELRAFLQPDEPAAPAQAATAPARAPAPGAQPRQGSKLRYAFADGEVVILHTSPGRTRRGSAEHAEYYANEEKVILSGGQPRMDDSLKGATQGRRLTYWSNNDSLLVEGGIAQPVVSRIRRN